MPDAILIPANVILGLMIAGRFSGFSMAELHDPAYVAAHQIAR